MSENRQSRGMPIPSLWQVLVSVAAIGAGWLLWLDFRTSGERSNPEPRQETSIKRLLEVEALVEQGSTSVPDLIALSASADSKTCCYGLLGLGRLGAKAAAALGDIRERLSDEDPQVRYYALTAFTRICGDKAAKVAMAARMLDDSDCDVRDLSAGILSEGSAAAVRALVELRHSEFSATRLHVIRLLQKLDRHWDDPDVTAALRDLLDDTDREVRVQAIIAAIDRNTATVDEVRGWLRETDQDVINLGLRAIDRLGPEAAVALPELQHLFETSERQRVPSVAQGLRSLQTAARPAAPALLNRIEQMAPREKLWGIETLSQIGADSADIVRLVTPLISNSDSNVSREARQQLARADPEAARRLVSRWIARIEAGSKAIDLQVLDELWGLESQAQAGVPLVVPLLRNSDRQIQSRAIYTLGRIGPAAAPAVPALTTLLGRAAVDTQQKREVIDALGRIGQASDASVPLLLEIVNHSQPARGQATNPGDWNWIQAAAIEALGRIGNHSPKVLSVLRLRLTQKDEETVDGERLLRFQRHRALQCLVLLVGDPRELLPDLLRALDDDYGPVRAQAALAIAQLPGDRRDAVEPLIAALVDDSFHVRSAAALALREVGPAAKAAVGPLRDLLRDGRNEVSNRVRERIGFDPLQSGAADVDLPRMSVAQAARSALAAIESRHLESSGDSEAPIDGQKNP